MNGQHDTIVLVAINARYSHCSLAARSLMANMRQPLQTALVECEIKQPVEQIAEVIAAYNPAIVAIGVYIWNRVFVTKLLPMLRASVPDARLILGGPEISFDTNASLARSADYVICGEAELQLPQTCEDLLAGVPVPHILRPQVPELSDLHFPISQYTDTDIAHRNIYIETSRGCPCACRFCLSSRTAGVRYYPLDTVFQSLDALCARGAKRFRFVDRSFNLAGDRAVQILAYFLQKNIPDLFLHLEIVPEYLSPALRQTMLLFSPGCLHVETGIQSLHPDVLKRVHRMAEPRAALEGIHWLTHEAHATVHADLIAGLPGEDLASFVHGFIELHKQSPAEIQLGTLKHLPGTDLDCEPGMEFSTTPPYEVIQTDAMTVADIDHVRRFAAHWERIVNRNHFPQATALLLQDQNPWDAFDSFSRMLEQQHGRHSIGIVELARALHSYLTSKQTYSREAIRAALADDYLANGRRIHLPAFLRPKN